MGTRSLTKIQRDGETLLALYKQFDGQYFSWGTELLNFLKSGVFVNGLADAGNYFNGVGDFALQLVKHFKTGPGGLYAASIDAEPQECNYRINYVVENFHPLRATIHFVCENEPEYSEDIKVGYEND